MNKKLVRGEYCYAGNSKDKKKRIWLGNFNGLHACVSNVEEDRFKNGKKYEVIFWDTCTPIEDEPEYTYPMWFKSVNNNYIARFDSIDSGEILEECMVDSNTYKKGHKFIDWMQHTNTSYWTQVDEPPKTKIVYEYVHQVGDSVYQVICLPENNLSTYMDTYCQPTGREFEVEV